MFTRLQSGFTTKDANDSTPKDEKAEHVVPALPSQPVDKHLSRSATLWRRWRIALLRPRWRRLTYGLVGILLITIWCGVTVNFAQSETKNQAKEQRDINSFTQESNRNHQGQGYFLLSGNLVEFDPDQRQLTITWSGLYLLNGSVEPFGTSTKSDFVIGLYENEEVVVGGDPRFGLQLANDTALPIGVFANPWQNYNTGVDMEQASPEDAWKQPEFGFPFDVWTGSITFGATYRNCFANVTASNACGTYWDFAYLTGSIINWKYNLTQVDTCLDETVESCNLIVTITGRRAGLVVFACVVAVMVNWFSTLFIFIMTMEGVILQRFEIIEGPQLLAVCFTALFALPSVRSILPGAPDFGALIDIVGIVPNVIIISICTTLVAIATLRKLIEKNTATGDKKVAEAEAAEPV